MFSKEAIEEIMALTGDNDLLFDRSVAVLLFHTGMRVEDATYLKSKDIMFVAETAADPRHFSFTAEHTKNDKLGTGPLTGRLWLLPCTCSPTLTGAAKGKFKRALAVDAQCKCPQLCPFGLFKEYLTAIPDAFGRERENARKDDASLESLRLFRAQVTTGTRRFLEKPAGKNKIAGAHKQLNALISEHDYNASSNLMFH